MMRIVFLFLIIIIFSSCFKQEYLLPQKTISLQTIDFVMEDTQLLNIQNARKIKWYVQPDPKLGVGNDEFSLSRFALRGESTLNFQRKSFSINLEEAVFCNYNNANTVIDKFKLLSYGI